MGGYRLGVVPTPHRRQRRRGPDPQCLTANKCVGPPIIINGQNSQSHVRCTIFVNIIDFVVSAVVEQVYGSTFKFCLLKMQEICPLKCFVSFLSLNAPKCVWWTCWGSLQRSPRSPGLVKGKEREGEWERAGASIGTPGDVNCVTEILRGTKIRKLGEPSLNLVSLFSGK